MSRHRGRDRPRRPAADLRLVPAGRPRGPQGRGHRSGAHPDQADRRAPRRAAVARQRARPRKHVRLLHPPRTAPPTRPLASGESATAPRPATTRPVVVVIEDDRSSAELMSLHLAAAGLRPVAVRNGTDGLAAVRDLHPAAVILDIRLPGMDGWDVLGAIKGDPHTASTPVVVVSVIHERGRGFALGASDYLVKPVGRDDLLAALRRARRRCPSTEPVAPGRRLRRRRPRGARAGAARPGAGRLDGAHLHRRRRGARPDPRRTSRRSSSSTC